MKRQEFQKHFVSVHRLVYCGFVIELSAQGRKEPDTWVSGNTVAPSWRRLAAMPKQDGQSLERGPHTAETAHTWAGEPLPLFEYTQTCKAVHVPPLLNAILAPKAGSELLSSLEHHAFPGDFSKSGACLSVCSCFESRFQFLIYG